MTFSYIFNQNEFNMLMALAGYDKLFGLFFNTIDFSDNSAGYIFNKLYNDKTLEKTADGFVIASAVQKIINSVGEFEHCIIIKSTDDFLSSLCCYIKNGQVTVISKVNVSNNKINISSFTVNQFIDYLSENSYLPKSDSCIDFDNERLSEFEKSIDFDNNTDDNILLSAMIYSGSNLSVPMCKVFLIRHYLFDYILVKSSGFVERKLYTKDNYMLIIENIVFRGEK